MGRAGAATPSPRPMRSSSTGGAGVTGPGAVGSTLPAAPAAAGSHALAPQGAREKGARQQRDQPGCDAT